MTINYSRPAATAGVFTFIRLLFRWRGSIWKSIWLELLVWLFIYYNINIVYRYLLVGSPYGEQFTALIKRCKELSSSTSNVLSFALGFYVTQIYSRWWSVFMMIPWPDAFCFKLCAYLRSSNRADHERDRTIRKTMLRYISLSYVITFRDISERIKKRFPTLGHLVPSLMTADEEKLLLSHRPEELEQRKYWLPLEWTLLLLKDCYMRKQVDPVHYRDLVTLVCDFRERLHNLIQYDWVNVPLVYTQVVHLCTMAHFFIRCIGAQTVYRSFNEEKPFAEEGILPLYCIFEFVFFVGWLNVAQVMLNPFGMDDDDFDVDTIIERNLILSYSCVDTMFERVPQLVSVDVKELPHTKESALRRAMQSMNPMKGSCTVLEVSKPYQRQVIDKSTLRAFVGRPSPLDEAPTQPPSRQASPSSSLIKLRPTASPCKIPQTNLVSAVGSFIQPSASRKRTMASRCQPSNRAIGISHVPSKSKDGIALSNDKIEPKSNNNNKSLDDAALKRLTKAAEALVQKVEQKRVRLEKMQVTDKGDKDLDSTQDSKTASKNNSKEGNVTPAASPVLCSSMGFAVKGESECSTQRSNLKSPDKKSMIGRVSKQSIPLAPKNGEELVPTKISSRDKADK